MNLTFRTRVLVATVSATLIAVFLLSATSFLTTRSALLRSADQSLQQLSSPNGPEHDGVNNFVYANGKSLNVPAAFIDETVLREAMHGHHTLNRTVNVEGQWFRELLVPAVLDIEGSCSTMNCIHQNRGTEVYVLQFNGQVLELRNLLRNLSVAAAAVLLLAISLGLWLTRQALRPLELVTNEIEEIANENDVTRRIGTGGVDELGRLRRVFNKLLTSVEESQALQRQLVLDASHELRTPLTSLRTNAQVMTRASELTSEDVQQLTHDMVTQVDELATLITDLGELARGERSEGSVVALRWDEVVDECVETARTYARIKNITIDAATTATFVEGRRDRLVRAISNLLTNAVKFTPESGAIRVRLVDGVLTVADSGPGIADEDSDHVFDRFWRAPSSRGLPGSGLGLAIVAQVIDEFGGAIDVGRDEQLGGALFTMTLPTIPTSA